MDNDQEDEDMKRVQAAIDLLAEHFDAVQIFATRCEAGSLDGTVNINLGAGNFFARYGHVKAWTLRQDGEEMRAYLRKE
jgi:hypothetical protein